MKPALPALPARARSVAGFTLIEVLVATFVFAIVLASLMGTWRIISNSTSTALRLASETQRRRLAMQSLESALGAAQLFQANAALYAFLADTSGDMAELSFVATLPDSFPGSGFFAGQRLRRLTVRVEEGNLVLHQLALLAPTNMAVESYPLVLAQDVVGFQLEFWDRQRNEFVPEWIRSNQMPAAVRFTLGFAAGTRGAQRLNEIVTRTVRLPDSFVGINLQGGPVGAGGQRPTPPPR